MILWVALGIIGVFMLAMGVLVVLVLRAGSAPGCPHGDTPAGCEACYDDYLTWGHRP